MSIVTLTTDFGESDHFVGVMKGVILGISPKTAVIDITHQIAPFEIAEGAFVVSEAFRYFPKRTVHVAVVDPGVGTARRPILVEAEGHYFVGPDNGLLSMVYGRAKAKVRHMTNTGLFLKSISATFNGRDIFSPAAAHLALGVKPAKFGPLIDDYLRADFTAPGRVGKRHWTGTILKIDRFGNLITNFHVDAFPDAAVRPIAMLAGVRHVETVVKSYAEGPFGEPVIIVGSSGYLEVVVNQGNAAKILGCGSGSPVELNIF